MATHTLGDSHRQTRRHPRLLLVVGAVQVSVHEHQALYQLERSRLPKNCLGTEKCPRAPKIAIPLFIPFLPRGGFLSLYCQAKDSIEYAEPDVTVRVEQRAGSRVRRLIVAKKVFPVQDGLHRIDVLPVYIDKPISICAGGQSSGDVKNTVWRMQVYLSKQGRIHERDKV